MILFLSGCVVGCVTGMFLLWHLNSALPRACAYESCTTNHWELGPFCSHHILDEYEEEHGRGARPATVTVRKEKIDGVPYTVHDCSELLGRGSGPGKVQQ
ncbi:hypothetical protein LCGC14_1677980 [marine sediment metagenome]|uniref:Uncharacterized protein n=1 Tax=marine sediment metagenome TaxID=412755 RepID=A0A0F9IBV5_9ZZZZ